MNLASTTLSRRQSIPSHHHSSRRPHKKRPRSSVDPSLTSNIPTTRILSGVVSCFSGQERSHKQRLESIVNKLGGRNVRDFDPQLVTHLIVDRPKGLKYEYVKRHAGMDFARKLHVVTSGWIEACRVEGKLVEETRFKIDDVGGVSKLKGSEDSREGVDLDRCTYGESRHSLPKEIHGASLYDACKWMLDQPFFRIFSCQSFLLVGFGQDDALGHQCDDFVERSAQRNTPIDLLEKVSNLIRKAGGTIFWGPNDSISIVVLGDKYSEYQREDVRSFCRHHPRGPIAVTAHWILSSLYNGVIETPPFPPRLCEEDVTQQPKGTAKESLDALVPPRKSTIQSNVFGGDVFAIVRLVPPTGTMSFEKEDMESLIVTNGGLLLSGRIYEAVKSDLNCMPKNLTSKSSMTSRKFYVLTTGGYTIDPANFHPLLAELSKLGVTIVSVTPVWVKACANDRVKYDAEDLPIFFQPQSWPIRLLPQTDNYRFIVSVTGYVETIRYGIIWMLKEIGAQYTDNLKSTNTHLICKDSSGKKFEKSCEWGLQVVSVDWLYHIIRQGYEDGCEKKFSISYDGERENSPTLSNAVNSELRSLETSNKDSTSLNSLQPCASAQRTIEHDGVQENSPTMSNDVTSRIHLALRSLETSIKDSISLNFLQPHASARKTIVHDGVQENSPTLSNEVISRRQLALRSLESSNKTAHSLVALQPPASARKTMEPSFSLTQQHSATSGDDNEHAGGSNAGDAYNSSYEGSRAPLTQVNDARDKGESQVIWFAGRRGRSAR